MNVHVFRIAALVCSILFPFAAGAAQPAAVSAAETNAPAALRRQALERLSDGRHKEALTLLAQARTAYQAVLAAQPANVEAARGLALTLFDLGDYEGGRRVLESAIATRSAERAPKPEPPAAPAAVVATNEPPAATTAATLPPAPAEREWPLRTNPLIEGLRGVRINLDQLYDPDPEATSSNLAAFVDRTIESGANAVLVDAFAAPDADGAYGSAYFSNSVTAVRTDLLQHVVEALADGDVQVFAVMPVLSIAMPPNSVANDMLTMERRLLLPQPSRSWRRRMSPFHPDALERMTRLYRELAAAAPIRGVVFGDDAYLTDREDLNPEAIRACREATADPKAEPDRLTANARDAWTRAKTERLDAFCEALAAVVRETLPDALFLREIYAPVVTHPPSEAWLAQNYTNMVAALDGVVVLADAEMEKAEFSRRWLADLARAASAVEGGAAKSVFLLPTHSARMDRFYTTAELQRFTSILVGAGGRHVTLGPDYPSDDRPRFGLLKRLFDPPDSAADAVLP